MFLTTNFFKKKHNFDLQAIEHYNKICRCLPKELRTHVDKSRVFSIMKNSPKNIQDLKKCIASTVRSQSYWGEDVPIS